MSLKLSKASIIAKLVYIGRRRRTSFNENGTRKNKWKCNASDKKTNGDWSLDRKGTTPKVAILPQPKATMTSSHGTPKPKMQLSIIPNPITNPNPNLILNPRALFGLMFFRTSELSPNK